MNRFVCPLSVRLQPLIQSRRMAVQGRVETANGPEEQPVPDE